MASSVTHEGDDGAAIHAGIGIPLFASTDEQSKIQQRKTMV
jgi:hypothetical protein